MVKTHKDLDIWQLAIDLVLIIYKITDDFPPTEIYNLTSQMRRSAISIPTNISEGSARNTRKDELHFLNLALSSLTELETLLIISEKLQFIGKTETFDLVEKLRRKLLNYIEYKKEKLEVLK